MIKWVNDVHALFQLEKDLDFPFMLQVEKDNTSALKEISEYDYDGFKVSRLYKFEEFALKYKSLAKEFIQVIKPTLPVAWLCLDWPVSAEFDYAILTLSAKKVLFDRVVQTLSEFWKVEKKKWEPEVFCQNTWMELNKLKL